MSKRKDVRYFAACRMIGGKKGFTLLACIYCRAIFGKEVNVKRTLC